MPLIWALTAVLSQLLVFGTWTLYLGNQAEFAISYFEIITTYLPIAIVLMALALGICYWSPRLTWRLAALFAALHLAIWIEGNLLRWDPGLLNGNLIDWSTDAWRGLVDIPIWGGLLLVALVGHTRLVQTTLTFSKIVLVLQTLLFVFGLASTLPLERSDRYPDELKPMSEFSSTLNVMVILLDGLQGDIFTEIVTDPLNHSLREGLNGFIHFDQHTGIFPTTYMVVPALLSGEIYRNHVTKEAFLDDAIGKKSFLPALARKGFEIDLASDKFTVNLYRKGVHTHAYAIPNNLHLSDFYYPLDDALRMLDLTLFRHAPHLTRKAIYREDDWLLQTLFGTDQFGQQRYFAHDRFLKTVTENAVVSRDQPVFKLFHLMSSHIPAVVKQDCQYAGHTLPVNRENMSNQSLCALKRVNELFTKLKQLGIYDQTLIVLMSDHGAWIAPNITPIQPVEGGLFEYINPIVAAMAIPVMAIKLPQTNAPFHSSHSPTTIPDLPATLAALLDLDADFPGENMLEIDENAVRDREYLFYDWRWNDWRAPFMGPMTHLIINGSPYDSASWRVLGEFLPPNADTPEP